MLLRYRRRALWPVGRCWPRVGRWERARVLFCAEATQGPELRAALTATVGLPFFFSRGRPVHGNAPQLCHVRFEGKSFLFKCMVQRIKNGLAYGICACGIGAVAASLACV